MHEPGLVDQPFITPVPWSPPSSTEFRHFLCILCFLIRSNPQPYRVYDMSLCRSCHKNAYAHVRIVATVCHPRYGTHFKDRVHSGTFSMYRAAPRSCLPKERNHIRPCCPRKTPPPSGRPYSRRNGASNADLSPTALSNLPRSFRGPRFATCANIFQHLLRMAVDRPCLDFDSDQLQ